MKPHIVKFFQFLEDEDGKNLPLRAKLLNSDKFKFTKEELDVDGDLFLSNTNITSLPEGLRVSGYLYLIDCTSLKSLPNELYVGVGLTLNDCTSLKSLPNGLKVGGYLDLEGCTSLKTLPDDLEVGWSLFLADCTSLTSLPTGLKVGRHLNLDNTPLAAMYSADEIRDMIEAKGGYVNGRIKV